MDGQIEFLRIESSALRDNRLGDPHIREVVVYIPHQDREKRLPSVYVLPAYGSSHRALLNHGLWKTNTVERFDEQVRSGQSKPAILVIPDAANAWGGSQYLDSAATGNYQTFIADDVTRYVDQTFPTLPHAGGRAVIGRSSGGFGALRLAMDRPDRFAAVGSHAGDMAFEETVRPLFHRAAMAYEKAGGVAAFAKTFRTSGPTGPHDYDAAFILASAAAYAPSKDQAEPFTKLPFDPRTLELRDDVWNKWLEQDPVLRISTSIEALTSMRMIFIDAGSGDEYGLQYGARQLSDRLSAINAQAIYEEFEGGHRGTSHRFADSLPRLIAVLDSEM